MDKLFWKLLYVWIVQVTYLLKKQEMIIYNAKDYGDLNSAERNLLSYIMIELKQEDDAAK